MDSGRLKDRITKLGRHNDATRYGIMVLLALLSIIVLLDASPAVRPVPLTDSSVFLYIGERILDGAVPYRDIWDHKGPLVYYINALGQIITPDSRWGVWWLEVVAVSSASWLGYELMRRIFGTHAALVGSVAWLLTLPNVLEGGNLVEEYALPLQFAALYFFWCSRRSAKLWNEVMIGAALTFAFLLRPNIIGIPTAILIFLMWQWVRERRAQNLYRLVMFVGPVAVLIAVTMSYFAAQEALPQLWDNMFAYNFLYAASSLGARLAALEMVFHLVQPLSIFSVAGWLLLVGGLRSWSQQQEGLRDLLLVLLLAYPIEIGLAIFAGRSFPHYFMSLLPVSALLSGFLWFSLFDHLREVPSSHFKKGLTAAVLLSLTLGAFRPIRVQAQQFIQQLSSERPLVDLTNSSMGPFLDYADANFTDEDALVVWGTQLAANWLSGHENPARSIYQIQFFTPGYPTKELGEELYNDILETKPVIVDASVTIQGFRSFGVRLGNVPGAIRPVYDYVDRFYTRVDVIEPYGWPVYRYTGPKEN